MSYKEMTKEELQEIRKEVAAKYDELKAKGLKLDMSRVSRIPNSLIFLWE